MCLFFKLIQTKQVFTVETVIGHFQILNIHTISNNTNRIMILWSLQNKTFYATTPL